MFDSPQDVVPTFFEQGFQILNRTELDAELSTLFRRWDPSPEQRADFVGWAWVVAAAADFCASENRATAAALLRIERDLTHRLLSERLHTTSSVDLNLVSKRMFLDWVSAELVRERAAA
jgi:hypothetical protein